MFKRIGYIIAVAVFVGGAAFGGSITWTYSADLGATYTSGWLVELIEDVGKDGIDIGNPADMVNGIWDDHSIVGGDAFITPTDITTTLTTAKGKIVYGDSFSAPGGSLATGDMIYTVIYNAATFGAATQYMVVDAASYSLPGSDVPATYDLTAAPAGSWTPILTPVPEPGTIMLFALGLVTLVARRKRG